MGIKSNLLTKKQIELYTVVKKFYKEFGYSPTLKELSDIQKKDKTTLRGILLRLEEKGYVSIEKYKKRGIRLVSDLYDESICFCEDDIKEKTNVKHRFSKSNK